MVQKDFQKSFELPSKDLGGKLKPIPLNLSPSALGRVPAERMSFMSWTNSSTLSVVLDTIHNESPDSLRSSCTPSTLQIEEKGSSLCVETFQPRSEKMELTQKSTCLDSLSLDKQRKSSKYADHISFKRDDPIFQIANETLRKAVTDAIEPKGNTLCLKIFESLEDGSYTARYESSSKALSESGTCL